LLFVKIFHFLLTTSLCISTASNESRFTRDTCL
jgi:hypothetical protein